MKNVTLIVNASLVNEGEVKRVDVLIENEHITKVAPGNTLPKQADRIIEAEHLHLFPGVIDDQVHFREPGLTHKGEIYTEAKAAVAGGITSYMEMPNTVPGATTIELLEEKYSRAHEVSLANYSFFMGTTNDNIEEVLKIDPTQVCGVKIFMGSSTGNMLVENPNALEDLFSKVKTLIAVHCEDDQMIKQKSDEIKMKFGENIPAEYHPIIRHAEACYSSSSRAVALAKKHGTRLHILHISTEIETELFDNTIPLREKKITAEACIHHLWFTDADYTTKGMLIKWNPAVKTAADRAAVRKAVRDGRIDVIATDHAPHTLEEKAKPYFNAPSGAPLVQHSLVAMLELVKQGVFQMEMLPQKMSHNVADLFRIVDRGYVREGYFADLVLVDLNSPWTVTSENILYKCGWSPLEGQTFSSEVKHTFVSGHLVYSMGEFNETRKGQRLTFNPES